MVASSPSIKGPCSKRCIAIRNASHVTFFQDTQDRWWSTFFGNNRTGPKIETPGIVPVEFDANSMLRERNGPIDFRE